MVGSTTPKALASRFRKSAAALEKAGTSSVEAGALKMTTRLRAAGKAHGPLHGKKGRPINLGARYTVKAGPDGGTAFVKPKPAGAWQIAETGAGPHLIGGGGSSGRRSRKVTYLFGKGYGHPVRGPIAHGGARGSRAWTIARDRAEPETLKAMQQAPLNAVRDLFGT